MVYKAYLEVIIRQGLDSSLWRRRWHPTPVLLPGKSHGWWSLVGCSPWGRWRLDTTELLNNNSICLESKELRDTLVIRKVKNLPAIQETLGLFPGSGRPPGKGNGTHSSILAWKIPWTEEHGRLQFMGSQRVGHDWVTFPFFKYTYFYTPYCQIQT